MYDFFLRQKQGHALYTGQSQTCPLPEGTQSGWLMLISSSILIAEQENKGTNPLSGLINPFHRSYYYTYISNSGSYSYPPKNGTNILLSHASFGSLCC